MKKRVIGILILLLSASTLLSGCKSGPKNPYKGQDIIFEANAKFINSADTPEGEVLGDKSNFVIRVDLNAYNLNLPEYNGKTDKTEIMNLLTSDTVSIEAGDYISSCIASDSSNLAFSVKNHVIEGATLYFEIPAEYRDDKIRFAIYNTVSQVKDRKLIFETSDFDKSNFNSDVYVENAGEENADTADSAKDNTDADELTDLINQSTVETMEKPDGVVYSGTAAFEEAEKFTFNVILSSDLSKAVYVEYTINNLHIEQVNGNTLNTFDVGETTTSCAVDCEVKDGKIRIEGSDFTSDGIVLDSCIYGVASYTYKYPTDSTISIDLGSADTVLENTANPGTLPDNLDELLQQFKTDNNY